MNDRISPLLCALLLACHPRSSTLSAGAVGSGAGASPSPTVDTIEPHVDASVDTSAPRSSRVTARSLPWGPSVDVPALDARDRARRWIRRGVRFELAANAMVSVGASDASERGPWRSAVLVGARWVLYDQLGRIFTAQTYTGPARDTGLRVADGAMNPASSGLATIIADGALSLTDGASLRPVSTLAGVRSAIMIDPLRGAAWAGDALHVTVDGGASWRSIDVRALNVFDVGRASSLVIVSSADGRYSLDFRRAQLVRSRAVPDSMAVDVMDVRAEAVLRALVEPSTMDVAQHARFGERWLFIDREEHVVAFDQRGTLAGRSPSALPAHGCALTAWGASVVALCERPAMHFVSTDGVTFRPMTDAPRTFTSFSDDGVHAFAEGACPGSAAPPSNVGAVCVRRADSRWHTQLIRDEGSRTTGSLFALSGHHLARDSVAGTPQIEVTDLEDERLRPTPLTALIPALDTPDGGAARVQYAGFARDALFAAAAPARDEITLVAIGPREGPLAVKPLPLIAISLQFIDANRGVAIGRQRRDTWVTDDGGDRWSQVAVDRPDEPWVIGGVCGPELIRCDGDRCLVFESDVIEWPSSSR